MRAFFIQNRTAALNRKDHYVYIIIYIFLNVRLPLKHELPKC